MTANPYLEHRPTLAHAPDGLWAAWEVSEYPSYRTTYATWRRVVAARIDPDGLKSTPDFWDAFADWHSSPRLLASSTGTLHLSTRRSRGRTGSWDVALSELTDAGWRPATIVTRLQGRDRAAPLAEAAGRIWVAVQEDNLQGAWNTAEEGRNFRSEVRLAAAPEQAGEAGAGMVRVVWPDTAFDSAVLRERFGEDRARYVTEQDGRKLNLYWGQFHEHSDISVDARQIDLSPDDNYTHNRDIHRMDFSALTDHDFNMSAHIWSYMGKLARWQEDPGKFVTFLAMEWTSSFLESTHAHPHGYYGHRNLILQDTRYPRWFLAREGETPADVWRVLRADGAEFIHIPHQLADERVPMDWDWVDEEAQPLAEIFQHRGSYEGEGVPRQANGIPGHYLQDAWADGVIIGVIASPDHGGGRGKAAVYAPELTRASLLDACRSRHTYGTTGAKIVLDVRVDGHLMGDKVALREGPVAIEVFASGTRTLAGIDILKNNQVIHSRNIGTRDTRFTFTDTGALSSGTYYYVRVRQAGGELAWSSPVWFLDEARLGDIQHREGFVEPGSTEGE